MFWFLRETNKQTNNRWIHSYSDELRERSSSPTTPPPASPTPHTTDTTAHATTTMNEVREGEPLSVPSSPTMPHDGSNGDDTGFTTTTAAAVAAAPPAAESDIPINVEGSYAFSGLGTAAPFAGAAVVGDSTRLGYSSSHLGGPQLPQSQQQVDAATNTTMGHDDDPVFVDDAVVASVTAAAREGGGAAAT